MGEAELVMRLKQYDPEAVSAVVKEHGPALHRYVAALVGDYDLAEDVVSETLMRMLAHIDTYTYRAPFRAWLYRIAANLAAQHYRAQRRASWLGLDDFEAHAAAEAGPQALAEQKEELARLAHAVAGLNEEQRLVITGKFVETMSNAEIAAWLGKTEGAVKSLQHRALSSLARLMRVESPQEQR